MTVILVRHGESDGNSRRIIQGSLDTHLTDLGRYQARRVAARFSSMSLAAIYGTNLRRAYDTATTIAAHHAIQVCVEPGLAERTFGEAQGLTWDEVATRWSSGEAEGWWDRIPGVEPLEAFRERAVEHLESLLRRHEGELALAVSHGGTIGQTVAHALGVATNDWPRIRIGNTSVTVITRQGDLPVVTLLNDLCHLRPDEETEPPLA